MIAQSILLISFCLAAIQAGSLKSKIVPFGLSDDVRNELEDLRETVLGSILAAQGNLAATHSGFQAGSTNTQSTASIKIEQEESSVRGEINTVKELGNTAGVDVTSCLNGREDYLSSLSGTILSNLAKCVNGEKDEGSSILSASQYIVDITINRVDALDFQLGLCETDSQGCVSPIRQQVELETEQIPQEIKVEVSRTMDLWEGLKVSVQECSDLAVSEYVSGADNTLRDIISCVDALIASQ